MQIGICGASYDGVILDNTIDYIGVDGGVRCLLEQGIIPKLALGDFDSLEDTKVLDNLPTIHLNPVKDCSDTHYAIDYAIKQGYNKISVYGVTGGRMDHYMAMIALIQQFPSIDIHIIDKFNDITILNVGEHIINCTHQYFSLFSFEDTKLSIQGAKYPLDNYLLRKDDPLCLSNEALKKEVLIKNNFPILFIQSNPQECGF